MGIIFTLLLSFFGIFTGLVATNFQNAQERGRDTVRQSDINSLFAKLEEHYNNEGDYPTEKQLREEGADNFPGIDPKALIDENGVAIWEPNSEYFYNPSECGAIGCQKYKVGTLLEDGTTYSKQSLN